MAIFNIRKIHLLSLAFATFLMAGCTSALLETTRYGIFTDQDINLTQRNYAAADYLIQQADDFISKNDLIVAMPLQDKYKGGLQSDLGRVLPEEMGVRLAQLGYRVDLNAVGAPDEMPTNYLAPAKRKNEEPDFILSGNYYTEKQDVNINTRITNARTGQVMAVYNHVLPLNKRINTLANPKARIFKVEQ